MSPSRHERSVSERQWRRITRLWVVVSACWVLIATYWVLRALGVLG